MRIQTNGDYKWRTDLYDGTADRLGEGTRSGGIDRAYEFTRRTLNNLEAAANHPDMTGELADISPLPASLSSTESRQAVPSVE